MNRDSLPVVVIGAGPVGLAAAAHLVTRGLGVVVLEAGPSVGASIRQWGHVQLFSPWRYDVDRAAAQLLEAEGWRPPPPETMPTGNELVGDYLEPLSKVRSLRGAIQVGSRVTAITRVITDKVKTRGRADAPFVVRVKHGRAETETVARAVIDASGTWLTPNPLGAAGIPALGEEDLARHIHYGIPDVLGADRARYEGRTTLVVGAGHSAANALLGLAELAMQAPATRVIWTTRGEDLTRVFGGGESDGLPARGKLGADLRALVDSGRLELLQGFAIREVREERGDLVVRGVQRGIDRELAKVSAIIAATGQRPDLGIARELRLAIDPWLESAAALGPLIDPNEHSCGTVRPHGAVELAHPEPDFYVIGSKSYGRAPTFLLATGYEQARSVVAMIAGDEEAARRVELDLPETGVCTVGNRYEDGAGASCCAPKETAAPAPARRGCCG